MMEPFITAYKTAFTRYVDFSGRTSVGGFWRFVAVNFFVLVLLSIVGGISSIFLQLYPVYVLAVLLPSIAIAIRRLHDTGKSGWMILLGLIPLFGIIVIVFCVQASDGPNEYGTGPDVEPPSPGWLPPGKKTPLSKRFDDLSGPGKALVIAAVAVAFLVVMVMMYVLGESQVP
jgi:uncharacterized membrane protein YhaH (DUF805 family)